MSKYMCLVIPTFAFDIYELSILEKKLKLCSFSFVIALWP